MTKRIVLIEDNQMLLSVYRAKLTAEGFQVETAADGEHGLNLAMTAKPDLVLLDLMLPKVDGVEILKRIRTSGEIARVPVIVLSNSFTNDRLQEVWAAGATQVLVKASLTPKQLAETVRGVLSGQS